MVLRPLLLAPAGRLSALVSRRPRGRLVLAMLAAGSLAMAAMPLGVAAHSDESRFVKTNLVSDVPGWAPIVDPSLVNAWGMSFGPTTPLWVSDNGSDSATLYKGATLGNPFVKVPLTVGIPDGAPTGQVFNGGPDFMVSGTPARFIFASENGFIDAWRPGLPPTAVSVVATPGAVYKGLAISTGAGGSWLYAANFHDARIDVFNGSFALQSWAGAFMDSHIPAGYAPFNIENLGGKLYVTYAVQNGAKHDDLAGKGHGFVDVYDTSGHLLKRLVRHGRLNSPWGLQIAPKGFGEFGGDLLVGNFGDGRIDAYNARSGDFEGVLRGTNGEPIWIDGLWGLQFGNGVAGTPLTLLFTAGPVGETHGLLGSLTLAADDDD